VVCVLIRDVQFYSFILLWAFEAVISCFQYACIGNREEGIARALTRSLFASILFQFYFNE